VKRLFPRACSLLILSAFSLVVPMAFATNYYVAANGSDSNSGTSNTSPWLHAPGMPSCTATCAGHAPVAGDKYIFRGGDTWHYGNSAASPYIGSGGWNWKWNGSNGNPIYIGVDQTWYTGSAWVRPILSGDNPLSTSFVSSCAHAESGSLISFGSGSLQYVTLDNFEFSGVCWTGQSGSNGAMLNVAGGDTNIIVSNLYCHGWTMTSGSSDNFPCITSFGSGTAADFNQYFSNVFDGSDSPHFAAGSSGCQWFANDPSGCASGQGMNGSHFYDVHSNVFRYLSNMIVTANCHTIHDNLFEYLYDSFASGSVQQHANVMNCLGGATGDNLYWYNNVMRHTHATEDVYLAVRTNVYFFNNLMYDNMNSVVGPVPGGCIRFNSVSNSSSTQVANIYNNTFGDATCLLKFEVSNSPLTPWNGTGNFQNNHIIAFSPQSLSSLYICATGGQCAINDDGNEIFQTQAVANSQGYTPTNNYSPTSSSGATVGAGANQSTLCPAFSADGDFCDGTTSAVMEQAGSGGKIASYPAVSMVPRPGNGSSAWNAGAYEFGAGPQAPTNLQAVVH
jgi:hypothetical protein